MNRPNRCPTGLDRRLALRSTRQCRRGIRLCRGAAGAVPVRDHHGRADRVAAERAQRLGGGGGALRHRQPDTCAAMRARCRPMPPVTRAQGSKARSSRSPASPAATRYRLAIHCIDGAVRRDVGHTQCASVFSGLIGKFDANRNRNSKQALSSLVRLAQCVPLAAVFASGDASCGIVPAEP